MDIKHEGQTEYENDANRTDDFQWNKTELNGNGNNKVK